MSVYRDYIALSIYCLSQFTFVFLSSSATFALTLNFFPVSQLTSVFFVRVSFFAIAILCSCLWLALFSQRLSFDKFNEFVFMPHRIFGLCIAIHSIVHMLVWLNSIGITFLS